MTIGIIKQSLETKRKTPSGIFGLSLGQSCCAVSPLFHMYTCTCNIIHMLPHGDGQLNASFVGKEPITACLLNRFGECSTKVLTRWPGLDVFIHTKILWLHLCAKSSVIFWYARQPLGVRLFFFFESWSYSIHTLKSCGSGTNAIGQIYHYHYKNIY